jgi:hypothetical protein
MEELLNLLKVKLCNCTLEDEEVVKIKDYIENGGTSLNLKEIHKYNIENSLRSHYNIREEFWKLMDSFMDKEEVFKRILSVFFAIGQESFFKVVYNRFYSVPKTADYLKPMESKERLLVWFIKTCSNYVKETIIIVEEMISEDREILSKAFLVAEDDFVKLALAALAIKNSWKLPEDGEEFIKQNLENGDNINKYLRDKQTALVSFFAYAHYENEGLREIISNIVNKSTNKKMLFDDLVDFICYYDKTVQSYDVANKFNIDKKLYALRLINLYIREENKQVLKEIKERIKEIPLVFRESLEASSKRKPGKTNLQDVEMFSLAFFIYSDSKEEADFKKLKQAVETILNGFVYNSRALERIEGIEKAKLMQYVIEGENPGCVDACMDRADKFVDEGYLWMYYAFCFKLIYSMEQIRGIIYRFMELNLKTERYALSASVMDTIIQSQSMSYISLAKEFISLGIGEKYLILTADAALNQYNFKSSAKATEYLKKLCVEENIELVNCLELMNINVKELVLENLFNINKEKYSELLAGYLSDDSKIVRDKVVSILSLYEGCKEKVISNFKNRKTAVREAAARVLINFDMRDFKKELERFAEKEKNEKVKVLILNIINADYLDDGILESAESISNYCAERLKKTAYVSPEWIPVSGLSKVKYEDGNAVSKDVITYLLSKYSLENVVERNSTAEQVIQKCNKQDLDQLGNEILSIWINNGADTKQKWILALISAVGGFNVVDTLKTQIELWSKSSRGAIACDAVKALALNGSDEALIIIDTTARKFKHKQIKKAAEEAFVSAAKMLNLTEEDLADK